MFQLHPRLNEDTYLVGSFELCLLLLSKDANYPWFILVPQVEGVSEIHHLSKTQRNQLMVESCTLSEALVDGFDPDKLNVASLGNMVPQLHIHHIVRYRQDRAWPGPVWGAVQAESYTADLKVRRIEMITDMLASTAGFSRAVS